MKTYGFLLSDAQRPPVLLVVVHQSTGRVYLRPANDPDAAIFAVGVDEFWPMSEF